MSIPFPDHPPFDTCAPPPESRLTKRETFAAMAMQGFLSDAPITDLERVAKVSVQAADALIAALNEEGK